jgi:hypothetical protein
VTTENLSQISQFTQNAESKHLMANSGRKRLVIDASPAFQPRDVESSCQSVVSGRFS